MTTRRDFLKSALALAIVPSLEALAAESSRKTIVIDAGHGMGNRKKDVHDPGAVYDGKKESEIVLDQAKRIKNELTKKGHNVKLTRKDETTNTSLAQRVNCANSQNADVFVSLHCNAAENQDARGYETFSYKGSKQGAELSTALQSGLRNQFKESQIEAKDRGTKEANFYVLKNTKMPSALIESGFLSNKQDRSYLTKHPIDISKGIAKGIAKYFAK
jgi:N-acetylmuramoyl-L-alanine amidase